MNATPIALKRVGHDIELTWSNGVRLRYNPDALRRACPCAMCREKNSAAPLIPTAPLTLPVLSLAETRPLEIERMQPVGNYAYNIHFSDGHNSGIFTFEQLQNLGEQAG